MLELPEGVAEDDVVQSALRRAVRVYGLSRYRVNAPRVSEANVPAALVLGFGNVNEERIRARGRAARRGVVGTPT